MQVKINNYCKCVYEWICMWVREYISSTPEWTVSLLNNKNVKVLQKFIKCTTANSYTNLSKPVFLQQCITCTMNVSLVKQSTCSISQRMTLCEQCSFIACEYFLLWVRVSVEVNLLTALYLTIHLFILTFYNNYELENSELWTWKQSESLQEPQQDCPCLIHGPKLIIKCYYTTVQNFGVSRFKRKKSILQQEYMK